MGWLPLGSYRGSVQGWNECCVQFAATHPSVQFTEGGEVKPFAVEGIIVGELVEDKVEICSAVVDGLDIVEVCRLLAWLDSALNEMAMPCTPAQNDGGK